ncbi:NAD(P)/FAD-dependent oxidoreductase [Fundicoccus culcitae]|uniref:NAD(P)/FAD-dependent oxidoreductase n=1 Tax=Fundicoccus culcitae TaxID=2969821 RepID=A0ABY5P871_9LACT|nr:FAD/NAD(P)-binding oxidoreductase [Fundicoccus culcitae]UUX34943.1 NAD(P)/FAD-dependent oxidoreductase [Fundicoccus culcitae]
MKFDTLIVGGSIAGYNVAKQLRALDYTGTLAIVEKEPYLPYDRKELSKTWLKDREKLDPPYMQDQAFYDERDITLLLNTQATAVDPQNKYLSTNEKGDIYYEYLVLATGSQLRTLDVPHADAEGIYYLRNFENALAIKERAKEVEKVAIVGGGFIGLELAATLSTFGLDITVIEYTQNPLGRIIGMDASDYFVKMHQAHGIKFIVGSGASDFQVDDANQVTAVVTDKGVVVPAQMVIVGVGVVPNLTLEVPGLEVDHGIVVNEFSESSLPNIFAVGDATIWPYNGKMIHIEHWENAFNQGKTLASNIIDPQSKAFKVMPYFWTDQYDQTFEYLGNTREWADTVIRGDLDSGKFTIAYLDDQDIPLAILFANHADARKEVAGLLRQRKPLNREMFKDREHNLTELY